MTTIAWTEETWNPVRGCSAMGEGCRNCYAARFARRFCGTGKRFHGFVVPGRPPRWTGRVELDPARLLAPLRGTRARRVFVNSMSDLFHERLPFEDVARVFAVMALTPHVTYQVLTKRPGRMHWFLDSHEHRVWAAAQRLTLPRGRVAPAPSWPLPNVWLGVSVEDQRTAAVRLPRLLCSPAALRFASFEPLLDDPGDLTPWLGRVARCAGCGGKWGHDFQVGGTGCRGLDWVIVGGESGPQARPCDLEWIRGVLAQCREANVPVFVKQLGACASDPANGIAGAALEVDPDAEALVGVRLRQRAGADPSEWPADLRVREFPRGTAAAGELARA